jgi:hypothetical protein
MSVSVANNLTLNQEIIEHKVSRIFLIGADASRLAGRQENILRSHGGEGSLHFCPVGQIRLCRARIDHMGIAAGFQLPQQSFSDQGLTAGYVDAIRPVHRLANGLAREVLERRSQVGRFGLFPLWNNPVPDQKR